MNPGRVISLLLLLSILAILAGCACRRCDRERDRFRADWGEPQDSKVEKEGYILTETWFYWETNSSVVFLWDDRDCSCDVSTYHFDDEGEPRRLDFHTAEQHPLRP